MGIRPHQGRQWLLFPFEQPPTTCACCSARPGPNIPPQVTLLTDYLFFQFNPERNSVSLGIRMRWGMRNGIFHVAKEEGSDKVLGVAMWLRPQPADQPPTWNDWLEGWRLYFGQIWMNLYYGRGGLNVKVTWQPLACHTNKLTRDIAILYLEGCSS